ncbi:MAG: ABC transporter permease subunit [Armatimonadota bacterium]|nr:ABC transporter permease subunit [Armatimonadota bacterium]
MGESWALVWGLRGAVVLVVLGVWEWAGRVPVNFAFPTATATARAFAELLGSGALPRAFGISAQAFLLGYGAAVLVGVPFGLLMGLIRPLGRIARVYLDLLITMPMAALVPLVILTMGVRITSSALIVFIFSMPFLATNAYGGVRDVQARLYEMARAFDARWLQILRMVVFPSALPMVLAGMRYGLSRAFIGLVIAELLLAPFGVGRIIVDARSVFAFDRMFAAVLSVILAALLLLSGLQQVEARLLHWRR